MEPPSHDGGDLPKRVIEKYGVELPQWSRRRTTAETARMLHPLRAARMQPHASGVPHELQREALSLVVKVQKSWPAA